MKIKRIIVIGDVHGCFDELELLLDKVSYDSATDRLIFVGDLINKGPKSVEVLKYVYSLGCEVVLGNHELAFLDYMINSTDKCFSHWDDLISCLGPDKEKIIEWMKSWPSLIEEDDFIVVHAGLEPNKKPNESSKRVLTSIRTWDGVGKDLKNEQNPAWYELYQGEKLVIYGHWAKQGLVMRSNTIGLDSGCVYGKQLSAFILPEKKLVQVDAFKAYQSVK